MIQLNNGRYLILINAMDAHIFLFILIFLKYSTSDGITNETVSIISKEIEVIHDDFSKNSSSSNSSKLNPFTFIDSNSNLTQKIFWHLVYCRLGKDLKQKGRQV